MRNYKKYFEKYCNIKVPVNYEIHHIDLNHKNNDISNLMILPKELHRKYHKIYKEYFTHHNNIYSFIITGNKIGTESGSLYMLHQLIEVVEECNKWYDFTLYLKGQMPNIHKIKLGG